MVLSLCKAVTHRIHNRPYMSRQVTGLYVVPHTNLTLDDMYIVYALPGSSPCALGSPRGQTVLWPLVPSTLARVECCTATLRPLTKKCYISNGPRFAHARPTPAHALPIPTPTQLQLYRGVVQPCLSATTLMWCPERITAATGLKSSRAARASDSNTSILALWERANSTTAHLQHPGVV